LTCWPPAPDERENRQENAAGSSRQPARVTGSDSSITGSQ
jgi:hypothetical protein